MRHLRALSRSTLHKRLADLVGHSYHEGARVGRDGAHVGLVTTPRERVAGPHRSWYHQKRLRLSVFSTARSA
jgi:hypothetical protein